MGADLSSFLYGRVRKSTFVPKASFWQQDKALTVNIEEGAFYFDDVQPVSTAFWFYGFENLSDINIERLDTSSVTNMGSRRFVKQCRYGGTKIRGGRRSRKADAGERTGIKGDIC